MKYLKRYNELNEGLRNKMVGISKDEAIEKSNHLDSYNKIERGIKYGITELVQKGIEESDDLKDDITYDTFYLLRLSVLYDNLESTELLLKNGANPNILDEFMLRSAAYNSNKEMVDLLIKYGADLDKAIKTTPYEKEFGLPHNDNMIQSVNFLKNYIKNN